MINRRALLTGSTATLAAMSLCNIRDARSKGASQGELNGRLWEPSAFSGLIATGFFQEDVPVGRVASHRSRGVLIVDAKQIVPGMQPRKGEAGKGIVFPEATGSHLLFPNVKDSLALYRWSLSITRLNRKPVETPITTQIFSVNEGTGSTNRHPRQAVICGDSVVVLTTYHAAGPKGTVRADLTQEGYVADGASWNSILSYRRDGKLHMTVNGLDSGFTNSDDYWAWGRVEGGPASIIGTRALTNAEWAYDLIMFGQGELSDAQVRKLEGWAHWRVEQPDRLPSDHPYRHERPLIEKQDFAQLYQHDANAWNNWGTTLSKAESGAMMGKPRVDPIGFDRVFFDDFARNSVAESAGLSNPLSNWFAPGSNTAVGQSARLLPLARSAELYVHKPDAREDGVVSGGSLTLSLLYRDQWYASCITTLNDAGQGRYWKDGGIFRLRCRFPRETNPAGGFFPAFWAYGREALLWRHRERIEIDFWEFDGKNDSYLNGGTVHVHKGQITGLLGHLDKDAPAFEIWDGEIKGSNIGQTDNFHLWDGEWHTWEFRIDPDLTYLNVTIENDSRWIELFRCPTPVEFLQPIYLMIDYALRTRDGEPDRSRRHDFVIDYVEVLQKSDRLKQVEAPFLKLPSLEENVRVGATVKCLSGLPSPTTGVRYIWHVDGIPVKNGGGDALLLDQRHAGKMLRCLVRATSSIDQTELWSDERVIQEA